MILGVASVVMEIRYMYRIYSIYCGLTVRWLLASPVHNNNILLLSQLNREVTCIYVHVCTWHIPFVYPGKKKKKKKQPPPLLYISHRMYVYILAKIVPFLPSLLSFFSFLFFYFFLPFQIFFKKQFIGPKGRKDRWYIVDLHNVYLFIYFFGGGLIPPTPAGGEEREKKKKNFFSNVYALLLLWY